MKKIFMLFAALAVVFNSFASVSPVSFSNSPVAQSFTKEDPKTPASFKELKDAATKIKGAKLTLKEKVLLKVFGKKLAKASGDGKSQLTAVLLAFFLGALGIHRFYLGYTWQGIVQLLTLGGLGIWAFIDFIRILTGSLKPKDGEYDKTL